MQYEKAVDYCSDKRIADEYKAKNANMFRLPEDLSGKYEQGKKLVSIRDDILQLARSGLAYSSEAADLLAKASP